MGLFSRPKDPRPLLYVVEPFGYLLTDWQRARTLGSQSKVDEALSLFAAGASQPATALSSLVGVSGRPARAELLETTPLPLLGERRLVDAGRRRISITVGLAAETRGLIDGEAGQAAAHGLLALMVGARHLHSTTATSASQHALAGTILFEPKVGSWPLPLHERVCFLSLLPGELLAHYWHQYFPDIEAHAVSAADILSAGPLQAEWLLHKSNCIGSASLRDRYQILNLLDKHYRCRLQSTNPIDSQLRSTTAF